MDVPSLSELDYEGLRVGVMQGADRWIGVVEDMQISQSQAVLVLRFHEERAPVLGLGSVRPIEFLAANSLEVQFAIPGRVLLVHRENAHTVVFQFEVDHSITEQIQPRGGRREHCRVKPAPGTVRGWVRAPGRFVEVGVVDLSPAGLGCEYAGDGEGPITGVWRTQVQLQLPTVDEPLIIAADIRRRVLRRRKVLFGLEFHWAETEEADQLQRRLRSYLHRRELEILRNLRQQTEREAG